MQKASFLKIFYLNAYWLGLSVMWNGLHVIILPAVLLQFVAETQKNTVLGLLTFAGLVIAMIVQPVSGAISDQWASRWGKRRPLMTIGTLFDFLFLACLGWAGGLPLIAVGYIGLQFSSNIAHGPVQGLLPDEIPPDQYGAASGMKNILDMAGMVIASLVLGRLVNPNTAHPIGPVALIASLLAIEAAITILLVHEKPSLGLRKDRPGLSTQLAGWRAALNVDFRANTSYWWLIASRFVFLLGIYDIQGFAQYFIRDVISKENFVELTGNLLAVITLGLIAFAILGGWLGDRIGHRRVLALAAVVGALGCLLLLLARTPITLLLTGSVVGAGIGLFLTSNWALANELAPAGEAGKYLGLTNLATAGSGAVGRLGGPLIDLLNNAHPGANQGYVALFLFGAVCTLASGILLKWVVMPAARRQQINARNAATGKKGSPDL